MKPKPTKIIEEFPITKSQITEEFGSRIFLIIPKLLLSSDYHHGEVRRWRLMPNITNAERFEIVWEKGDARAAMRIRCRRGYLFAEKFFALPKREKNIRIMFTASSREGCESAFALFIKDSANIPLQTEPGVCPVTEWFKAVQSK